LKEDDKFEVFEYEARTVICEAWITWGTS